MKQAIVLVMALLLSACGSFPAREPDRYFILEIAPTAAIPSTAGEAAAAVVVVAPTTAASFYDTQDIVYSRASGTRAYYRYNHWTERPQRVVHAQLRSRLGSAGAQSRRPVLATHLEEIYHDAAETPGNGRVTLTAELVDSTSHDVIAHRRFSRSTVASSYDAAGAVGGMREALGALLDDVAAWVVAQSLPNPGSSP